MNEWSLPQLIRFGRDICGDLAQARRREWWLANGRGAYAAGTIAGTLERCYHGLLIAPVDPPLGRHLVLAKADATLIDGADEYALFTNAWASGAIDPQGYRHIESFRLDGRMPVWRFAIGDIALEQRIWMEHGAHTTFVAWRLVSSSVQRPLALRVRLLAAARDHHAVSQPGAFQPDIEARDDALRIRHGDRFCLTIHASGGSVAPDRTWHENFHLGIERERGLPDRDAHLSVGTATLALRPGAWVGIAATLEDGLPSSLDEALQRACAGDAEQIRRARKRVPELENAPAWIDQLVLAADSFVFARPLPGRPDGESIIAGYPWFGDWGRDTMIALPGIALATGRIATARRILETFASFIDGGMLPNVFPGAGDTPEYNTADAALWFIEAWRAYVHASGDQDALERAFPALAAVVHGYRAGTRYGIGMDPEDGLLRAGEPGVQVTWMDAKIGDWVVTPRIGKPVEINALWYNALAAMAALARRAGHDSLPYHDLAQRVAASFARFVIPDGAGLYDVLDGPEGHDATLRPNQILAVSLPHSPLEPALQAHVVALVGRRLLASCGLRSLDPAHPDFRPQYAGGVWERDSAYHQGPVWAWLLGHYAMAHYRVHGEVAAALDLLEPVRDHLGDAGLGYVSEIFDGAAPHAARGAPAQAWSVACTLEAWWRIEHARRASELARAGTLAA
jgi:4-alpha-glucanotransferase